MFDSTHVRWCFHPQNSVTFDRWGIDTTYSGLYLSEYNEILDKDNDDGINNSRDDNAQDDVNDDNGEDNKGSDDVNNVNDDDDNDGDDDDIDNNT